MATLKKKSPCVGDRNGAIKNYPTQPTNIVLTQQDVILNFMEAINKAGLFTKTSIIADGRLHRFHVEGDKRGSENGWYTLYGDDLPAGAYGCWKRGISETWCAKSDQELTQVQRKRNRIRMVEAQNARKIEEEKRRKSAQQKAHIIWKFASRASDTHPYLVRKKVKSHGLRLYKGLLVIPMRDNAGNLHSLQFIDCDGNKRFLSSGRKKGCYFAIGTPLHTLCIAEGYATAVSIYEATGFACVVAFDAGNLEAVAVSLRNKFPNLKIIMCADNDVNTDGNPGLTKAKNAARRISAYLAFPSCAGDFNDLFCGEAV
ncbi:MAG: toprim domain-containing protein [Alphaproteobacteria bacterium]|nr:toprim domain-containing protein [Alphaproteobacteria bacterium]